MNSQLFLVLALSDADGSRGAAGALACAASSVDQPALLVDLGGRQPRPTLISSLAASALEEDLAASMPRYPSAARGQICQLALPVDREGLRAAALARACLPNGTLILYLSSQLLTPVLRAEALRPTGVLLRADMHRDRDLAARTVRRLMRSELRVAILGRRLGWVVERRALFGALQQNDPGALPEEVTQRLLVDQEH